MNSLRHFIPPARSLGLAAILLLTLLLAACTVPAVVVTPTPTPVVGDWESIQETGTLVVGTSADYPPFAFYDSRFRVTGFDPELARALGEELGLEIQIKDIPFDGLTGAIQAGQIDAAIGAISVTPERDALLDFTDIYYVSEDAFLAKADAPLTSLGSLEEVEEQALVGVQQGSVYQSWAERELVDKGVLPESNLLLYSDVTRAVDDLKRGRINLVIMDAISAETFAQDGEVKIVAQGLNRQRYAVALPDGANDLRRNLNAALDALRTDGRLDALAVEFLGLPEGEALPTFTPVPTATSTPLPTVTNTPIPAATATPARPTATATQTPIPLPTRCLDSMSFVSDLTFDDQNMESPPVLLPGQPFIKVWRVRNSGSCTWDSRYRLAFVRGNIPGAQMSGQPVYVDGRVPPGSLYDIQLPLIAPISPGTYQGFWQLYNDLNAPFGQRIWAGIRVMPPITATPRPTQTPAPQIEFYADRTSIRAGEPVYFTWRVSNVREVYFFREGQNWWEHGVAGEGARNEYPQRDASFYLRVVKRDNTVEQREIRVYVAAAPDAPEIRLFSVVPEGQIILGQCVRVDWDVRGEVDDVDIKRNGREIWENAPLRGNVQDCPDQVGNFEYLIEADGPGGDSRAVRYVDVIRAPQPTATPTATQVPPAVVEQFVVTPGQITVGSCVDIVWSVGGDPALIQIKRNGIVIVDNAPFNNTGQDCPAPAGTYLYRIEVTNRVGAISDAREDSVQVVDPSPVQTPTPQPEAPVIQFFNLSAEELATGECVTLSWSYTGDSLAAASITRNEEKILGDPPLMGDLIDCPPDAGEYFYTLAVASESYGTTQETRTLYVVPPAQP